MIFKRRMFFWRNGTAGGSGGFSVMTGRGCPLYSGEAGTCPNSWACFLRLSIAHSRIRSPGVGGADGLSAVHGSASGGADCICAARVLGTGGSVSVPTGRTFGMAGTSGPLAGRVFGVLLRIDGVGFSFGANGLLSIMPSGWGLECGGVRPVCFLGAVRSGSGAGASGVSGIRGPGDGSPSFG